jgi:monofunctional glycosyltransferase
MVSEKHHTKENKPFYVKPRFYIYTVFSLLTGLFLLVLLTITALRWVNPPATSFTLREDWEEIGSERYSLTGFWVPADEIPEHMKWAVIASEDQLFWEHWGFDLESIKEAWDERREGERVRGASTISQQVAKNLFLSPAESFFRKGVEAVLTFFIEILWPKERIMEMYLNIAEFGPGIFGIGKAAETFYDTPASAIDPEMATRLAAVLPSPKRMRVNPPSPYTEERSEWILRQMTQLSGIAYHQPEEIEAPRDTLISPDPPDTLTSISDVDFEISKLDSLINSFDANQLTVSDTASYIIDADTLRLQD